MTVGVNKSWEHRLSLKINKVRLWDYTDQWGNINGIICPKAVNSPKRR